MTIEVVEKLTLVKHWIDLNRLSSWKASKAFLCYFYWLDSVIPRDCWTFQAYLGYEERA